MNLQRLSLRWKLALLPVALVTVLVVAVLWLTEALLARDLRQRAAAQVQQSAVLLADAFERVLEQRARNLIGNAVAAQPLDTASQPLDTAAKPLDLDPAWFEAVAAHVLGADAATRGLSAAVYTRPHELVFGTLPPIDEAWLQARLPWAAGQASVAAVTAVAAVTDASGRYLLAVAAEPSAQRASPGWQVVVAQDLDVSLRPVGTLGRAVAGGGALLALALGGIGFGLSRRLTRPYAGVLQAVAMHARQGGQHTGAGFTRHLDELSVQIARLPMPTARGGRPPAEAEQALRLIAADVDRLRQVLDGLPIGAVLISPLLTVQFWNAQCESVFGWSADEVLGRHICATFAQGLDAEVERIRGLLAPWVPVGGRNELRTATAITARGGSVLDCEWTTIALRDPAGLLLGFLSVVQDVSERKRADEAIRASEQCYRLLFENNPQPMWLYDVASLRFMQVNSAAVRKYGWSREEFLALTLADIRPPEDGAQLLHSAATSSQPVAQAVRWRHRLRDASLIQVELTTHELDYQGRPSRLATVHDVTDKLLAQTALQASQRQFETLAQNAPVGIFRTDPRGAVLFVNTRWCDFAGITAQAALGEGWLASVHPEDRVRLGAERARARHEGQAPALEYRLVDARSGRITWVRGQAFAERDAAGQITGYVGTVTDITERRMAEEQLRIAATAFEQQAGILVTDPRGIVLRVNRAFERITGYTQDEVVGRSNNMLHSGHHDADFYRERAAVLAFQGHWSGEVWNRRKNGDELTQWLSITAVKNKAGQITQYVGSFVDISERKRAERALVESQRDLSELAQRLMAQEKLTTQRLAQALHDQLGQTLAGARMQLETLQAGAATAALPVKLRGHSQRALSLIDRAVHEVRAVLVDLRPPLLDDEGLVAALDNELSMRMRDAGGVGGTGGAGDAGRNGDSGGVALRLQAAPLVRKQRWPADVEYAAFMIAREAVGNALLHARASRIGCQLEGDARRMRLRIVDDGAGMPAVRVRPGHLGVVGMRERSLAIGARFSVQPEPGGGTAVELLWEVAA